MTCPPTPPLPPLSGLSALPAAHHPPHSSRRRAALVALLAGAGLAALPARANLVTVVAASRGSVLPVGTFNPLGSPRFAFRGSGFVVGDGTLLVTNAHVLPDPAVLPVPQVAVLLPGPATPGGAASDGREVRRATVLSVDRLRDLALLRLEGSALPALPLAEPGAVQEGMTVALLGYPIGGAFGFSPVTHTGIVASITAGTLPSSTARQLDERTVARLREVPPEVYQLDVTAYPGNSGGPLLDPGSGRVIGVVASVWLRSTRESALSNPTNITFAIPVRYLHELLRAPR